MPVDKILSKPTYVAPTLTWDGVTRTEEEWSLITNIPVRRIQDRKGKKWPVEKILTQKIRGRKNI